MDCVDGGASVIVILKIKKKKQSFAEKICIYMIAIRGNQNIVWKLKTLGCNCRRVKTVLLYFSY